MKNKFLMKFLCITLVSAMVMAGGVSVMAGAEGSIVSAGMESSDSSSDSDSSGETGTPEATETPTPEAAETPEATETPEPEATETPTPEATETPEVTETPEATETPEPEIDDTTDEDSSESTVDADAVNTVIDLINALGSDATKTQIDEAYNAYSALSDEEKTLISNYGVLQTALDNYDSAADGDADSDTSEDDTDSDSDLDSSDYTASEGTVVTYSGTTSVSNVHAGKTFYLEELEEIYGITFGDDFEDVMDEIEADYKEANKISDDQEILVRNWQDILAVYILQQYQEGETSYTIDESSKDGLAEIFAEMNGVVRDKTNILKVSYENLHVDDYIEQHTELNKKQKALLNKYTSSDCALLCCTITAAKGFIRQSAGDDIAEERVDVIAAAYSLVGKVGYFWGGKSRVIGWDSSWGSAATVSASGSSSTGSTRAYGLDCSGFVTWAFVNGYEDTSYGDAIGDGTSSQWGNCETIAAEDAQPGDLVFQNGPDSGSSNHVGILVGQTDDGDWIAVHCSSGQNGVVVSEAYSAGFRYIRCPSVYPTKEEVIAERESASSESLLDTLGSSTEEDSDISVTADDGSDIAQVDSSDVLVESIEE